MRCNNITAKFDKCKGRITIVEVKPTLASREMEISVNRLGFQYIMTTDTNPTPTQSKIRGINLYNKSLSSELEKQKGKNVMKDWARMSDSLFRKNSYEKMKEEVLKMPEVVRYSEFLDSISNGKEKPYVIIFTYETIGNALVGRLNKDKSVRVFYNYTIDPYKLEAEKIQY